MLLPKVIKDPVSVMLASSNCVPLNLTTLFVTMFVGLKLVAVTLPAKVAFWDVSKDKTLALFILSLNGWFVVVPIYKEVSGSLYPISPATADAILANLICGFLVVPLQLLIAVIAGETAGLLAVIVLLEVIVPLVITSPATCNFAVGFVIPIPTLPPSSI